MPKPKLEYKPPNFPYLSIVYMDDDILVVSKPSGLLSVPGKSSDLSDSVAKRALEIHEGARIVHRLDMATSGLMVLGLNAQSHRTLSKQFERRQVEKEYIAEVYGIIKDDDGRIDLPLRCDWPNRPLQMVDFEEGRPATTFWSVLERSSNVTRVSLTPITGRSHQLRVHMKEMGYPILGDEFYAGSEVTSLSPRLKLHARRLQIIHPITAQVSVFIDENYFN